MFCFNVTPCNKTLVDILNDVDSSALTRVRWLYNPEVAFRLRYLEFVIVGVKVMELIREDVSVWNEVESSSAVLLLHLYGVEAQSVLASDLIAIREVVDALELIKAFIEVTLTGAARPEDVPLVAVGEVESICFEQRSDQLRVTLQKFIEHLLIVNMVGTLGLHGRWTVVQELLLFDGLDHLYLIESLDGNCMQIGFQVVNSLVEVLRML